MKGKSMIREIELTKYYHLVPNNNGCMYLCQTADGSFCENSKPTENYSLVFRTEEKANNWLKEHPLLQNDYHVEWFAVKHKIMCQGE
jgi:hypothetical protein